MRIRTIKPEFFLHEEIYKAEIESKLPLRLSFIGLWCAADREGRFKWEPRKLGIQIIPYDNIEFSRVMDALMTRGFIRKYVCENQVYGDIPKFLRHQIINNRERDSEIPDFTQSTEYDPLDALITRDSRDTENVKISLSGREGKGKEGNKEYDASITRELLGIFLDPEFHELWKKWNEHLIDKKKKPTHHASEMQLKKLVEMGEVRAIAALKHSIAGGFQGIYEENAQSFNGNKKPKSNDSVPIYKRGEQ